MEKLSFIKKVFLFLTVIAGILSFGGYTAKLLSQYYFFAGPRFELRDFAQGSAGIAAFKMTVPVLTLSLISFFVFVILLLLSLVIIRPNFKKYGWFFISLILFLVLAPFQSYLFIQYDLKLINGFYYGGMSAENGIALLIESFKSLSGFPFIMLAAYVTIIVLFIFRPLTHKEDADKA